MDEQTSHDPQNNNNSEQPGGDLYLDDDSEKRLLTLNQWMSSPVETHNLTVPQKTMATRSLTPANLDTYGLPVGRQRASDYAIQLDPLVVFDHLDMTQCLGFQGASFQTAQRIEKCHQVAWACIFGYVCGELNRALADTPNTDPEESEIKLERRVKAYFVIAILILRNPPSSRCIRAKDIKSLMGRRLRQYNEGN